MIRVSIQQPVLPSFRVAFFNALAAENRFRLRVFADDTFPGHSIPFPDDCNFQTRKCDCVSLAGTEFFWQKNLKDALNDTDVLVVNGNPRYLSSMALLFAAKRRQIPSIWWGQGWCATSKPWRVFIRRWLMRWLPDIILLYTHKEAEDLIKMGFNRKTTLFLNNTIDTSQIEAAKKAWEKPELEKFRQKHAFAGKNVLLFCGRIEKKAELDVLIRAMGKLKNKLPDAVRLVVIGDGALQAKCRELARRLGVDECIRWCGPVYAEDELAPWFLSSCLFVYPGSIGLSINHAFAYGLPVITHGNRFLQMPEFDYLREDINGKTFLRSDVAGLAELILKLIKEPEKLRRMGQEALATSRDVCPFDGMVTRFAEALEQANGSRLV